MLKTLGVKDLCSWMNLAPPGSYKTALTEERRRFCFLVEKQCAVAKNSAAYHSKVS